MTGSLSGRIVVVTGAGSGIGRASALECALQGARVLCVDVDGSAAAATAAVHPDLLVPHPCDVTDEDAVEAMYDVALDRFGRLDGLFANAGIAGPGSILDATLADWHRVIAVNLTSVFLTARGAARRMVERGSGSIVHQASVAGIAGIPGVAAYSASKGGVVALTRQLAVDLGPTGIRVNAVCPGMIPTPLSRASRALLGEESFDDQVARISATYPLRRLGTPEGNARLVTFLLSDDADWITGAVVPLDGGLTA